MEGVEDIKEFVRRHKVICSITACAIAVATVMYAADKTAFGKRYPYSDVDMPEIPPANNWYVLVPKA